MAQQESEHLSRILTSAALSRAVSSIAELGVADLSAAERPQVHLVALSASKDLRYTSFRDTGAAV